MATKLVPLADVERLSARVVRILGGNPGKRGAQQGTNTYLVGKGAERVLIDTGEGKASWSELLRKVLQGEQARVSQAILTHWHPDHVGGVAELLRLCPGALIYKNEPSGREHPIDDGQRFCVDGATLRAVHAPGHTTDHMALVLEEEDAMFTGDNVLGHGTSVFEDLATYLTSLERMRHQFAGRAYPGHGAVIDDGPARIVEYIAHRAERERQVLDLLGGAGAVASDEARTEDKGEGDDRPLWGPRDLVKIIYKDVPQPLHLAAEHGLLQVLRKLQGEEKVTVVDGRWRIAGKKAVL
ncbi:MAG: hypothetical protein M1838_000399 [Thelocarpon superellum]|nr:MAG: hypothetical protein M1838_000399 [Thelocarpon superellum]